MKKTLTILILILAPFVANAAGHWPCHDPERCGPRGVPGYQPGIPFANILCRHELAVTFQEFLLPDGKHMGAGPLLWLNFGEGTETANISTSYSPTGSRILTSIDAFCTRELREISRRQWNYVSTCEGKTSYIVCDRYN